jgi:hypothetical protein
VDPVGAGVAVMAIFKKAEQNAAFLKMGLLGFAGSGKTWTASLVAMGLVQLARKKGLAYADKPVVFLDTENGSDYVVSDFEAAGIELLVAKTRAFTDLKEAMKEAETTASVLIIDSITHFWTEFCEAYAKVKNRKRGLEFQDWAFLKKEWRKGLTEPYLNSNLHIIMNGRAGYEYEHFTDDTGKKQLEKSGIKMRAEGELGFEPSLLVLMERDTNPDTGKVTRTAVVMKDRFRSLDGKEIPNPTFKHFLPHIEKLNLGGQQGQIDTSRTSEDMIEPEQYDRRRTDREIVLDHITNLGTKHFSSSADDKRRKLEILEAAFGTSSWTEIEKRLSLEDLQFGYDRMHLQLEGTPGRYGTLGTVDDEIPDHAIKPRVTVKDGQLVPVAMQ